MNGNLYEAYEGIFEDELKSDFLKQLDREDALTQPAFYTKWIGEKHDGHTARQRLEVYLHWNGIFGFTGSIYEIATGGSSSHE